MEMERVAEQEASEHASRNFLYALDDGPVDTLEKSSLGPKAAHTHGTPSGESTAEIRDTPNQHAPGDSDANVSKVAPHTKRKPEVLEIEKPGVKAPDEGEMVHYPAASSPRRSLIHRGTIERLQGPKFRRRWAACHVVVLMRKGAIGFYKDPKDQVPSEVIKLQGYFIRMRTDKSRPFQFKVFFDMGNEEGERSSPGHPSMRLALPSNSKMKEWMTAIARCIHAANEHESNQTKSRQEKIDAVTRSAEFVDSLDEITVGNEDQAERSP